MLFEGKNGFHYFSGDKWVLLSDNQCLTHLSLTWNLINIQIHTILTETNIYGTSIGSEALM